MVPFVSLVLPAKNEEAFIGECMSTLLAQQYPQDRYEIIVVDGNSADRTVEIVNGFRQEGGPAIVTLSNPKSIVPISMNMGIKAAKGRYIVRIDAHSTYRSDYIQKAVEFLEKTGAANVGGPMIAKGTSFVGKAISYIHHSPFGLGGGKFHDSKYSGYVDTVYLGAFRKEIFDKVGLYDERLARNQDIELNARIRGHGYKIFLTPEIQSTYYNRGSIGGLWKQNYKNGYWNVITKALNPAALSMRHFIPAVFVLAVLIGLILSFSWIGRLLLAGALGSYALANILFSLQLGRKHGWRYVPVAAVCFAALHFSYGFGTLISLFKGNLFKPAGF